MTVDPNRRWRCEIDGKPVLYLTNSKQDKHRKGTVRIWNNVHTALNEGWHYNTKGTHYAIIKEPV